MYLAAPDGIGVEFEQAEEARRGGLHPIRDRFRIVGLRRVKGGEDVDRYPAGASRRVNGNIHLFPQRANALGTLAPGGETLLPDIRLLGSVSIRIHSFSLRILLVDPWPEILGAQVRKGEQKVGQIPFGIDDNRRYSVNRGLLKQRQTEAGLSASGHSHTYGVGDQIPRIIEQRRVARSLLLQIVRATEVENA